jgi:hypothetical protein
MLISDNAAQAGIDIPARFKAVARYTGVPEKMLYAVAVKESQRSGYGHAHPWPWTLNIAGSPHYFDHRHDMFKALMAALKDGVTNIDIGPMQTNWFWQYEHIASPWMITDPTYNTKLGAQIIARHFRAQGDWWEAIGKYHRESDQPHHQRAAKIYADAVKKIWRTL